MGIWAPTDRTGNTEKACGIYFDLEEGKGGREADGMGYQKDSKTKKGWSMGNPGCRDFAYGIAP